MFGLFLQEFLQHILITGI